MSKAVLFLIATTVGLGLVSLHLARELRVEREHAQTLRARTADLERAAQHKRQALATAQFTPSGSSAATPPSHVNTAVGGQPIVTSAPNRQLRPALPADFERQ